MKKNCKSGDNNPKKRNIRRKRKWISTTTTTTSTSLESEQQEKTKHHRGSVAREVAENSKQQHGHLYGNFHNYYNFHLVHERIQTLISSNNIANDTKSKCNIAMNSNNDNAEAQKDDNNINSGNSISQGILDYIVDKWMQERHYEQQQTSPFLDGKEDTKAQHLISMSSPIVKNFTYCDIGCNEGDLTIEIAKEIYLRLKKHMKNKLNTTNNKNVDKMGDQEQNSSFHLYINGIDLDPTLIQKANDKWKYCESSVVDGNIVFSEKKKFFITKKNVLTSTASNSISTTMNGSNSRSTHNENGNSNYSNKHYNINMTDNDEYHKNIQDRSYIRDGSNGNDNSNINIDNIHLKFTAADILKLSYSSLSTIATPTPTSSKIISIPSSTPMIPKTIPKDEILPGNSLKMQQEEEEKEKQIRQEKETLLVCNHEQQHCNNNKQGQPYYLTTIFSTTMWIHIHGGDEGLHRVLQYLCNQTERFLIIEPQPSKCYRNVNVRLRKQMGFKQNELIDISFERLKFRHNIEYEINRILESNSFYRVHLQQQRPIPIISKRSSVPNGKDDDDSNDNKIDDNINHNKRNTENRGEDQKHCDNDKANYTSYCNQGVNDDTVNIPTSISQDVNGIAYAGNSHHDNDLASHKEKAHFSENTLSNEQNSTVAVAGIAVSVNKNVRLDTAENKRYTNVPSSDLDPTNRTANVKTKTSNNSIDKNQTNDYASGGKHSSKYNHNWNRSIWLFERLT